MVQISTIASAAALFSSSVLAAPSRRLSSRQATTYFDISFVNDQAGGPAQAISVPINVAGDFRVGDLLHTGEAPVFATSAQATNPGVLGDIDVFCYFTKPNTYVLPINSRQTFVDLDGNVDAAIPVDVSDFTIECFAATTAPSKRSISTRQTAAPLEFIVQLTNDIQGSSRNFPIIVNAAPVTLSKLYNGVDGLPVLLTSAQAINPGVGGGNVACAFVNPAGDGAIPINAEATFVDFDGNPNAAIPVDVGGFTIVCEL